MRGVGVGILFASLVLFAAYKVSPPKMTDQQIRSRAKELGMIDGNNQDESVDALFSNTEETSESEEITTEEEIESTTQQKKANKDNTKEEVKADTDTESEDASTDIQTTTQSENETKKQKDATTELIKEEKEVKEEKKTTEPEIVTITIRRGTSSEEVARQLERAGVIEDAKEFNDYLCDKGYGSKIIAGEYQFSIKETFSSIIQKITN